MSPPGPPATPPEHRPARAALHTSAQRPHTPSMSASSSCLCSDAISCTLSKHAAQPPCAVCLGLRKHPRSRSRVTYRPVKRGGETQDLSLKEEQWEPPASSRLLNLPPPSCARLQEAPAPTLLCAACPPPLLVPGHEGSTWPAGHATGRLQLTPTYGRSWQPRTRHSPAACRDGSGGEQPTPPTQDLHVLMRTRRAGTPSLLPPTLLLWAG